MLALLNSRSPRRIWLTAGISNQQGSYINSYSWSPDGDALVSNVTLTNSFGYVGVWGVMHEDNSLDFMRARFFSTNLGRFLTQDSLGLSGGDANLWRYAGNNPINHIDPLGTDSCTKECVIALRQYCIEICTPFALAGPLHLITSSGSTGVFRHLLYYVIPNVLLDMYASSYPRDPNDKTGVGGFGDQGFVAYDQILSYRVTFENEASATAPAQRVEIADQLDPNVDLKTFQFTEIGFGDHLVAVPQGSIISTRLWT